MVSDKDFLAAVLDDAGIGVFEHDLQAGHVTISSAVAATLGMKAGVVPAEQLADALRQSQLAWLWPAAVEVANAGREGQWAQEYPIEGPNSEIRWIAVHAQAQFGADPSKSQPIKVWGIIRDVTHRRRREDRQRFLLSLTDALRDVGEADEYLRVSCRMLCEHLRADRVVYVQVEGDAYKTLALSEPISREAPKSGKISDFGRAFLEPYHRGEVVTVEDVAVDERLTAEERETFKAAGIASFAGLMLIQNGRCVGSLGAQFSRPHVWRDHEKQLLREVLDRVSAATQTLKAQHALELSEARLRAAFESSSVGLHEASLETGVLIRANNAFCTMLGYPIEDILGRSIIDFIHPSDREGCLQDHKRLKSGEILELRGEWRYVRSSGTVFWADVTVNTARRVNGDPLSTVSFVRDISDAVGLRQQLARANAELEERVSDRTRALQMEMGRREEAVAALARGQKLEAIGRLTGGVAHDSNNMLTVISGNLELLEESLTESSALIKYVHEAQSAVNKMTQLNRRLLTYARQRRLAPMAIDLNAQIRAIGEVLERVIGSAVTVSLSLSKGALPILADPAELDNAILNLAINARDAMPAGGALRITTKVFDNVLGEEAAHDGLSPGRYAVLSVSDTGEGIPSETLPHVFEPFFTTKGPGRGTGLGLATVYGFLKQSGGHAEVESEVGKGATFTLYFPTAAAPLVDVAAPPPKTPTGHGERVLVVEDDPGVRRLTVERVQRLGYRVLEAADGRSALAALAQTRDVRLVFCDIVMAGGIDGFEVATLARELAPGVKVLLTSGFDNVSDRARAKAMTETILAKPYSQAELAQALEAALNG